MENLKSLFIKYTGERPENIISMQSGGSARKYYRIYGKDNSSVIGCYNFNVDENEAFFHLAEVFNKFELNVPKILEISEDRMYYLQTDLGDNLLYNKVTNRGDEFTDDLKILYKKVLNHLVRFQIETKTSINYKKCYPVSTFNREGILWDLNYFKYYFLKIQQIPFNESALENDFQTLADFISNERASYFMFRDFQSRNILIKDGEPWFVDFQGGRKGPLGYDVASLLYQAKAKLPDNVREELLNYYIDKISEYDDVSVESFKVHYHALALLRSLQVLGAYGLRGLYQKKTHFIKSIPLAIDNLNSINNNLSAKRFIPELKRCIQSIISIKDKFEPYNNSKFHLHISSFSYLNGSLPMDYSGHGGGYAFDCRALPNPGRIDEFKSLNGLNQSVQQYFNQFDEVHEFINRTAEIIETHIKLYLEREFNYLSVNFGCTGGQHRSVYCADIIGHIIRTKFSQIDIHIVHHVQNQNYNI